MEDKQTHAVPRPKAWKYEPLQMQTHRLGRGGLRSGGGLLTRGHRVLLEPVLDALLLLHCRAALQGQPCGPAKTGHRGHESARDGDQGSQGQGTERSEAGGAMVRQGSPTGEQANARTGDIGHVRDEGVALDIGLDRRQVHARQRRVLDRLGVELRAADDVDGLDGLLELRYGLDQLERTVERRGAVDCSVTAPSQSAQGSGSQRVRGRWFGWQLKPQLKPRTLPCAGSWGRG